MCIHISTWYFFQCINRFAFNFGKNYWQSPCYFLASTTPHCSCIAPVGRHQLSTHTSLYHFLHHKAQPSSTQIMESSSGINILFWQQSCKSPTGNTCTCVYNRVYNTSPVHQNSWKAGCLAPQRHSSSSRPFLGPPASWHETWLKILQKLNSKVIIPFAVKMLNGEKPLKRCSAKMVSGEVALFSPWRRGNTEARGHEHEEGTGESSLTATVLLFNTGTHGGTEITVRYLRASDFAQAYQSNTPMTTLHDT